MWRSGRTLAELRRLTGFTTSYLVRAFAGDFTPRLDRFRVLARALDVSVHDLAVTMDLCDPPAILPRSGRYEPVLPPMINRSEVARKTGLSVSYMSRILNDDPTQRRQPKVTDLAILAKYFRCSIDHLIRSWRL